MCFTSPFAKDEAPLARDFLKQPSLDFDVGVVLGVYRLREKRRHDAKSETTALTESAERSPARVPWLQAKLKPFAMKLEVSTRLFGEQLRT